MGANSFGLVICVFSCFNALHQDNILIKLSQDFVFVPLEATELLTLLGMVISMKS